MLLPDDPGLVIRTVVNDTCTDCVLNENETKRWNDRTQLQTISSTNGCDYDDTLMRGRERTCSCCNFFVWSERRRTMHHQVMARTRVDPQSDPTIPRMDSGCGDDRLRRDLEAAVKVAKVDW